MGHAREPVAPFLFAAVGENEMRHTVLYDGTKVDSRLSEFLHHDGFMGEGSSSSSVFFGHVGEQDACLACFCPGFGIGAALLAPAGLMRQEFLRYEPADRFAEHSQFVIQPRGLVRNGRHLGGISSASRLLAMKRPDYFVCIDTANNKRLSAHFGLAASAVKLEPESLF